MSADTKDPLASRPPVDDDRTLYIQGLQALRDGDAEDAAALLTEALRRQPDHQGIRRNLVRALMVTERFDQVVVQADAALVGTPDDAELHFARGTGLNGMGQHAVAGVAFAQALSLQPNHAPTWLNMGNASADLDDLQAAEASYRAALRLDPSLAEAHASVGYILTMQGRLSEAIGACETAIQLRPDFAQAHWNLAIAALLNGDLPRGFSEYEWRKRHPRYQVYFPDLPGHAWNGAEADGQTILVRAEQGFGDVIHFARYLPLIRDRGANPVLICASALVPLLHSMPGINVVAPSDAPPSHDGWIDQISLPRVFGTTLDSIPQTRPYLFADPVRVEAWQRRLQATGDGTSFQQEVPSEHKLAVGIAFVGNPKHPGDRRRSIPAELGQKLHGVPGVRFVNLQHGVTPSLLELPDLTPWMTNYAETAALIANLDLVITVDTSVAHLAGALGKPVWILLPHAPDWRWLLGRADSPWYRSARLFRQTAPGDWTSVLAQVVQALNHGLEPHGHSGHALAHDGASA